AARCSASSRCTRAPSSGCRWSPPWRARAPPPSSTAAATARASASRASPRHSRCPRRTCACSASRPPASSAAWAWPWRPPRTSTPRAGGPARSPRRSGSCSSRAGAAPERDRQVTTTRDIAAEARGLPREPTAPWILVLMAVLTAAWLRILAWQVAVLPDRVPTHFGARGEADGWSSKAGALAFSVLLPVLVVFPMPLLSQLAVRWPASINAPNRDWWAATAPRLRRFERLVREDLWLFAALTFALFLASDVGIVVAADSTDGNLSQALLWGSLALFLLGIGAVMARMFGSRYAEQEID